MAMILMAGALFLISSILPHTETILCETEIVAPEMARAFIELDRKEYFLGENVLLHFYVENTGKEPFDIEVGGDYRCASRHLRFSVKAFDTGGNLCDDPDPSGYCLGGLGSRPTIEPGKRHYDSIPLLRYRRIEEAGMYRIEASHDLGWGDKPDRKIPIAKTTIKFVRPTKEQARGIVEAMLQPATTGQISGEKDAPYSDFHVLCDPVYLPVLVEHTKKKPHQALEGIGSIATPEATQILIQLAGDEDSAFALSAAQTLDERLPDPQLSGELHKRNPFDNDREVARRWLVTRSWQPRFADDVADLAHKFLAREDNFGIQCGAYMLQSVGRSEDLPHLIRALDREVAAATKRPFEKDFYPRPRGACLELVRAAHMFGVRGIHKTIAGDSPGEAVVFLCAIGASDQYRPVGWESDYARLMKHEYAYVREVALVNLPLPPAESLFKLLPNLITDKDVDVQIAACNVAEKLKRPELNELVLKAFGTARERWLWNAASNALWELDAKWERLQTVVSRLDEEGLTKQCLEDLMTNVIDDLRS
jgi:hypothetical protein